MIVSCCVGGCEWVESDPSIVWLFAKAEQHRADSHDWVKRGKVHRLALEPAEDAQIIDFTRQLLREHRVDDTTFAALRQRCGERGLLELTGSIGYYAMLAMTVNACELEAAPGAEVLQA